MAAHRFRPDHAPATNAVTAVISPSRFWMRAPRRRLPDKAARIKRSSGGYEQSGLPRARQRGRPVANPAVIYKEAVWLPNEAVRGLDEYVKTAQWATPASPGPSTVQVSPKDDQDGSHLDAARFRKRIGGFIICATAGIGQGAEKRWQIRPPIVPGNDLSRHAAQPLPAMGYLDATAKPGDKHEYAVISVTAGA